jgi:hypothetical protein
MFLTIHICLKLCKLKLLHFGVGSGWGLAPARGFGVHICDQWLHYSRAYFKIILKSPRSHTDPYEHGYILWCTHIYTYESNSCVTYTLRRGCVVTDPARSHLRLYDHMLHGMERGFFFIWFDSG